MRSSTRLLVLSALFVGLFALLNPAVRAQPIYTVTVTVQGLPDTASTVVYVDGAANGTLSGGQSRTFTFTFASSPHIITVDYYVPNIGANGTRYYDKDTSWTFNGTANHVFTYATQYYLEVKSSYSASGGQGWYDAGTSVQATIQDAQVGEGAGTRNVFAGWSGDATGKDLSSAPISMNGPKTAVATWKTQFYLTVESDPPSVSNLNGSGWYDANSVANFSAPTVISANDNSRLRLSHWTGAYSGSDATGSTVMDQPKSVKANYIAQYLLTVEYNPHSITTSYNETHTGWFDANTNVQLGPAPATITLSTVERIRFLQWDVDGNTSTNLSMAVLMDKPHKVALAYKTQYFVEVRSSYGSATGTGWYDQGSTATIAVAATQGTWPISYTLTDWRVDPPTGTLTKTGDSWSLTVDRPYVVEADWNLDYVPLILVFGGGSVAIAAVAVGIFFANRRGLFNFGGPALGSLGPKSRLPRIPRGKGRVCSSCGNRIPEGATFCQRCGAPVRAPAVPPSTLDDKVYDYIVKHEGVISMSKASSDLGLSVNELKEITERLKKKGLLT